nr:uncharacterized protein LOC108944064 [Nicotiana tomentosiformis]
MEYRQISSPNCYPRSKTPMHEVVSMIYHISEKVTNITIWQHKTNARLISILRESHLRQQGRESSMTLTNSSTTPSPSQVRQMLQRGKPQHNQHIQISQNLPKQPHSPKGPYFPPPNYRPPTHYQHQPPFRPQAHIPIIPPPQMTQPRPPMNLPPQYMPRVPSRRDNLPQEECVDDSFDSIFIPLAKRFNFYSEMGKCEYGDALLESEQVTYNNINIKEENFHLYSNELTSFVFDLDDSYAYLCDDFVECEKESKVFDASTSINCFTYLIPTFERTFSLDFANASMRKSKNISFGVWSDHFEQKESNFIDYFVKVQQEKIAKGKKGLELTL